MHLFGFMAFFLVTMKCSSWVKAEEESFSYHKFNGPVSGDVTKVVSAKGNNIDYVARPDYTYSYGIQDPQSGNSQTHKESRDGDAVHGEYRVLQSDGVVRIVRYTSDNTNGFQATVEYEPFNK